MTRWLLEMGARLAGMLALVGLAVHLTAVGHGGWGALLLLAGVALVLPWRTL